LSSDVPPDVYAQLLHLHARYALGVDTSDAALVAGCFTVDAQLRVSGVAAESGAARIAARLTSRSTPGVLHTSTGLVARPAADGALNVTSYFFMFNTRIGQFVAAGRYDDVAVVGATGPQLQSRDVLYHWRAGDAGPDGASR
jgi:hypothetical protein